MGVRLRVEPASGYTSLYKQPAFPMSSTRCVLTASRSERWPGYTTMWLRPVAFVCLISLRWPFVLCTVLRGIVRGTCEKFSEGFRSFVYNQLHGPQTFMENVQCGVKWPTIRTSNGTCTVTAHCTRYPPLVRQSHTVSLITLLFLFCTHLVFQVISLFRHPN